MNREMQQSVYIMGRKVFKILGDHLNGLVRYRGDFLDISHHRSTVMIHLKDKDKTLVFYGAQEADKIRCSTARYGEWVEHLSELFETAIEKEKNESQNEIGKELCSFLPVQDSMFFESAPEPKREVVYNSHSDTFEEWVREICHELIVEQINQSQR